MTSRLASVAMFLSLLIVAASSRAAEFESLFESHVFKNDQGRSLPYRLMKPIEDPANSSARYPLVLFLHGAGERGDDNVKTLVHGMREFAKDDARTNYPCYVLVPQCPEGKRWVEVDWNLDSHKQLADDSETIKLVLELMKSIQNENRIDENRLYVTGLSMGGFGVWDLITRHPKLFAAAVPVCGGGDESAVLADAYVAQNSKKFAIWAFHGDQDTVVKPSRSRNMVTAMGKSNKVLYSEYAGVSHDSWNRAYAEPTLMKWMFAQRRPMP